MTDIIAEYIAEINREVDMRRKVYPGQVKLKKMTQATADKKTELIRQIGVLFHAAQLGGIHPTEIQLPIYEPDGSPFPITTLAPHITEANHELTHRAYRVDRLIGATRENALYHIRLLREIIRILEQIQGTYIQKTTQQTLFP